MRRIPTSLGAILLAVTAPAGAAGTGLTLGAGFDYSTGRYGTTQREEWWSLPFSAKYEGGPWTLRLSLPWVRRSGFGNPDIGRAATRTTDSGWGDAVAAASYALYEGGGGVGLDVGAKIKFGTADERKLLGTGQNDYSLHADLYKSYRQWTSFATLGWRRMGDTPATDYRNPWFGTLGGSYRLSAATSAALSYDWRQKLTGRGAPVSELTASLTHKFGEGLKLQGYLVRGFADASPDWGAGAVLMYGF